MFEKVSMSHPDKIADRIAGAIVDLAYTKEENPKIAVEVLIGHGICHIITETSVSFNDSEIEAIVRRIAGEVIVDHKEYKQDEHLAQNQNEGFRCGDNGIFRGMPITDEQRELSKIARRIWRSHESDGKYIITDDSLIICQSQTLSRDLEYSYGKIRKHVIINPLGYWDGGLNVDTGATNRKLGSDMGDAVTGGGLHGKDLSKADVSVNIYAHIKAQALNKPVELHCAIGDKFIDGKPYDEIVGIAATYIKELGGFEKFAEWGLI